MNDRHGTDVLAAQLDRLVSGDLAEADRRSLLAWLDEEPERWRACGLAFLEAQAWQLAAQGSAIFEWERGGVGEGETELRPSIALSPPLQLSPPSHLFPWLAVAALLLVAFALGLASGRGWPAAAPADGQFADTAAPSGSASDGPLLATVSLPTNLDPRLKAELTLPLAEADAERTPGPTIPAYVRQQWERRGFELTEEIRYLPAKLPDGRQVMVPITKVHVKYKGTPVS